MRIKHIVHRGAVVAGATATLALVGAGVAAAETTPASYGATSATVSVTHKMLAPDDDVTTDCRSGYHVHGGMTSGGAFVPTIDVHGDWIYIDGSYGSNQVGKISAQPGSWPTPEYQTVTVGLHNASFIHDHDGYYTFTCDPNV
jgi:hypothetical protein